MSALALAARIVLALALTVAAVAKLKHQRRVEAQMAQLFDNGIARVAARLVPVVELALAVALVVARRHWLPGVAAAVVLLAFTVVLVRAQARAVPCPCFGGTPSARPVGSWSVVRNGVLLALAVLATGDASGAMIGPTLLWSATLGAVTLLSVHAAR